MDGLFVACPFHFRHCKSGSKCCQVRPLTVLDLVDLILADFQEYSQRDPRHGSVIHGFSAEAKKASKFLRAYDHVHVSLESDSVLSFGPVCVTSRSGDSGVVSKQDVSTVSLPCSNEAFFQNLIAAFDKCCYLEGI